MRVTKRKKSGGRLSNLELLARFLNFDFGSGKVKQLRNEFSSSLVHVSFPTKENVRRLQAKLRRELLPLVAPESAPEPLKAYERLERLIEKINKLDFRPIWGVEAVNYDFDVTVDPKSGGQKITLIKMEPDEAKWKMREYLAPGQKPLQLLGSQWIVSDRVGLVRTKDLGAYLWWVVMTEMERGELSRLRVCGQCSKFFVQADARQNFCSDDCRIEYNNKSRLKSGYYKERRQNDRAQELETARRLLKEGKSPEETARAVTLSVRILEQAGLVK
jgi:hypothetical protein